jgi:hypothetical protein
MGIETATFVEGRVFPSRGREDPEMIAWRMTRMMQRGVLIGFDDPGSTIDDRTMLFIERFGGSVDRFPEVVKLLLNPPESDFI